MPFLRDPASGRIVGFQHPPLIDALLAGVHPEPNSGCWLWTKCVTGAGYGQIIDPTATRRMLYTHRVSFQLFKGTIPAGLCVLHKCDTPACCNPDHLFLGTVRDNSLDMVAKGRAHRPPPGHSVNRGSSNGMSRLTEEQARTIKVAPGMNKDIAAKFNIVPSAVSRIKHGRGWKHVFVE